MQVFFALGIMLAQSDLLGLNLWAATTPDPFDRPLPVSRKVLVDDVRTWIVEESAIRCRMGAIDLTLQLTADEEGVMDAMLSEDKGLVVLTTKRLMRLYRHADVLQHENIYESARPFHGFTHIIGECQGTWLYGGNDLVCIRNGVIEQTVKLDGPNSFLTKARAGGNDADGSHPGAMLPLYSDHIGKSIYFVVMTGPKEWRYAVFNPVNKAWTLSTEAYPHPAPIIAAAGKVVRLDGSWQEVRFPSEVSGTIETPDTSYSLRNLFVKRNGHEYFSQGYARAGGCVQQIVKCDVGYPAGFAFHTPDCAPIAIVVRENRVFYWPQSFSLQDINTIVLP
jgi:hypothetical protein